MATYNMLRSNKNDMKKRETVFSGIIPKGLTVAQQKAGILLGYTQEKALVSSITAVNLTNGAVLTGVAQATTGGSANDLKIGSANAAIKYYDAPQPIVWRAAGATAVTSNSIAIVITFKELNNTDGYLVGPNTANLRAPLDDQGQPCIEFPDAAPNTRAF